MIYIQCIQFCFFMYTRQRWLDTVPSSQGYEQKHIQQILNVSNIKCSKHKVYEHDKVPCP